MVQCGAAQWGKYQQSDCTVLAKTWAQVESLGLRRILEEQSPGVCLSTLDIPTKDNSKTLRVCERSLVTGDTTRRSTINVASWAYITL